MRTSPMRVHEETYSTVRELADQLHLSAPAVIDRAVEEFRRKHMFELADMAFAELKNNRRQWEQELEERREWETTLQDNLDRDDIPKRRR